MSLTQTTPSRLAARLHELLPQSTWPDTLADLDVEAIAHALSLHDHLAQWEWSEHTSLPDLLTQWQLATDEPLLVWSLTDELILSCDVASLLAPNAAIELNELVILGQDTPLVGLFHPQRKQLFIRFELAPPTHIYFYSVEAPYGAFSNFAPYPIVLNGERWPTTEHYFQAQKFAGTPREAHIRAANTPMEAARMGRDRKLKLRRDWSSIRVDVMAKALYTKFTQHEDLNALLLSTGDATLIEHTAQDDFWGDGGDGRGENWLGRLLMSLRDNLRRGDCAYLYLYDR